MLQLTFNPGLVLTSLRTTRPRLQKPLLVLRTDLRFHKATSNGMERFFFFPRPLIRRRVKLNRLGFNLLFILS